MHLDLLDLGPTIRACSVLTLALWDTCYAYSSPVAVPHCLKLWKKFQMFITISMKHIFILYILSPVVRFSPIFSFHLSRPLSYVTPFAFIDHLLLIVGYIISVLKKGQVFEKWLSILKPQSQQQPSYSFGNVTIFLRNRLPQSNMVHFLERFISRLQVALCFSPGVWMRSIVIRWL